MLLMASFFSSTIWVSWHQKGKNILHTWVAVASADHMRIIYNYITVHTDNYTGQWSVL